MLRRISRSFNDLNISLRLGLGVGILALLVFLVGVVPFTAANTQAQQTVRILQSATAVLAVLLGVGMVALMSRRLTRQMNEIDKVFRATATGDFDARAEVLSRDELGRTAEGINAMLAKFSSLTALGGRPPQAALEYAPVLFCLRDVQGRFMDVNPALAALFGLTPEQVIGRATHDLVDDKAGADVSVAHDRQVFETGEPLTTEESGFLRGERLTFLVSRFPLRDAEGNVCAVGSIGTDVTEQVALRERAGRSEAQLQAVLEHIPAPLGLNVQGVYTDVNPAFAAVFGLTPEQVIGKTVYDLVDNKETADAAAARDRQVFETGEPLTAEERGVVRGERLTFLVNRFPLRDAEGNVYAVGNTGTNITERKRVEEALRRRAAELEALREVSLAITAKLDLDALLHSIAGRAVKLLDAEAGGMYLYQPERDALVWTAGVGPGSGPPFLELRRGEGLSGKVWETGEPLIVDDYRHWEGRAAVPDGYPWTAILGVPIGGGEEFLGVINVQADAKVRTFTPDDAHLLSMFAAQAAVAIQNARLYEEVQARSRYLETLQRINATLRSTLPLSEVLETVTQGAGKALDYIGTLILVPDATGERLTAGAVWGSRFLDAAAKFTGAEAASFNLPLAAEENPMAQAYLSGEMQAWTLAPERIVVGVEPSISPRLAPTIARAMGARSAACTPLPVGEKVVGVLVVFSPREQFPEEERAMLLGLADQAGLAIEHAQLYGALRESEEKFRTLAERSPNMIFINKMGRVVYANEECEEVMGYKRDEFYAPDFDFFSMIAPEYREAIKSNFARHIRGEEVETIDYALVTKGGQRIEAILSTQLIYYEGGMAILGIITDITERVQAEEALRESEERYRTLFESSPESIFLIGLDGRVIDCNDATGSLSGRSKEEVIGKPFTELGALSEEDLPRIMAVFARLLSGEDVQPIEVQIITKGGDLRLLEAHPALLKKDDKVWAIQVIGRDITERKKAEQALQESEAALREAQRLASVGSHVNYVTGEALWSDEMWRIYGREKQELTREQLSWIHPDDVGRVFEAGATHIREQGTLDIEYRIVRPDGTVRHVHSVSEVVCDEAGNVVKTIGSTQDTTERKRAEEAIRQRNRELAALNAVSAVVNQSLDLGEILNAGLDKALELMRLDVGGVYLIDPVNPRLNLAVHRGVSSRYVDEVGSINVDKKSIEAATAQGRLERLILPVEAVIGNRAELKRIKSAAQREGLSLASVVQVLLQAKEEIVGAMVVASREPRQYSEAELQLLTLIGQQVAVAIYNARLYEAEQYERVLAQTLQRSAETLVRSAHLEDTLPHIVDQLKAVVQFDRAMVMLSEGSHLRVVEARGFPDQAQMIGRSYYYPDIPLLHASLTSDEPVVVEDARNDPRWVEPPDGIISRGGWLGARLVVWETVMGLLCIGTHEPFIYDAQDVEAVAAFAHQTAFALEHARIIEELEARVSDLQETQGHLMRAARLSAAGEIAAGVAHQINNPLTAIIAESDLLLSEIGPDGPGHESAVAISEAAERAGVVTQRLRDLARLGPISMQPVDVNRSLRSAVSLVRAQIEPSVRLITVLAPDLPPIQANRERLEDAWINLLLNAKDAIGGAEGGVIRVSSAPHVEGIKVTIQDNGVGIPPEHIDRVFDPFFTTKAYGRGTGLGLSICYDVVARHNGSINVESKEGQGATFVVTLPLNPGRLKPDHP